MSLHHVRIALISISVCLATMTLPPDANATPVRQINGSGILTGVNGLIVNSCSPTGPPTDGGCTAVYNASFVDGNCLSLFGICDGTEALPFATLTSALAASSALMGAIESPDDFDASLILGCGSPNACLMITPYNTVITTPYIDVAYFLDGEASDSIDGIGTLLTLDSSLNTANAPTVVYVNWVYVADAVPEPSTIPVVCVLLLTLVFIHRRRKAKIESILQLAS